jgi:cytidyltransferase-like protein
MKSRQPTGPTARPDTEGQAFEETMNKAVRYQGTAFHTIFFIRSDVIKGLMLQPTSMQGDRSFRRCLIGGTFDRFHSGHQLLIQTALRQADFIEVHVTNDEMAQAKGVWMQSLDDRMEVLLNWLGDNASQRYEVHVLSDPHGPAPIHRTADSIVATVETIPRCHQINEARYENGLPPLSILEAPHLNDELGGILSSSRIRMGLVDQEGHPWIPPSYEGKILRMPAVLDDEFKTPMGELFEGPEDSPEVALSAMLEALPRNHGALVAVGDVTVKGLMDMGILPDIAFVDGQTKREALDASLLVNKDEYPLNNSVTNPPGQLTPDLLEVVRWSLQQDEPVLVEVDGEEDLAPMFVLATAPLGTIIVYGQPRQGVVMRILDVQAKQRARNLLVHFEVEE